MEKVRDFIDNIQFITNEYMIEEGLTIGIKDCILQNKDKTRRTEKIYKLVEREKRKEKKRKEKMECKIL